jgi:hypothetical protein
MVPLPVEQRILVAVASSLDSTFRLLKGTMKFTEFGQQAAKLSAQCRTGYNVQNCCRLMAAALDTAQQQSTPHHNMQHQTPCRFGQAATCCYHHHHHHHKLFYYKLPVCGTLPPPPNATTTNTTTNTIACSTTLAMCTGEHSA